MHNNCSIAELKNTCLDLAVFQHQNVSPQFIVFICAINIILLITSAIGNTSVILAVWKTSSLRSPWMVFLSGLATTDFAVAVFVQPSFEAFTLMLLFSNSDMNECYFEIIFGTLCYTVCAASLMTVTAISVDRFLAIQYYLRYSSIVTVPRVIYITGMIWLISGFLATLLLWAGKRVFQIVMTCGIAFCLSMCTIVHFQIYQNVRRHQRQIQAQVQAVQDGTGLQMARFKKTAVNAFLVHYFLLFCYTPVFISILLARNLENRPGFDSWNEFYSPIVWNTSATIVFMNSAFNPLIYCWRLREMRLSVKRTLRRMVCKN